MSSASVLKSSKIAFPWLGLKHFFADLLPDKFFEWSTFYSNLNLVLSRVCWEIPEFLKNAKETKLDQQTRTNYLKKKNSVQIINESTNRKNFPIKNYSTDGK